MTSKEFVIWLQGFVEGSNNFNLTPSGWDALKEKLKEVNDEPETIGTPIGDGFGVPNTTPMWQHPHYTNPYQSPYSITFTTGSSGTTVSPYVTSFDGLLSTSTTRWNPSGSSWTYTNGKNKEEEEDVKYPPYTT